MNRTTMALLVKFLLTFIAGWVTLSLMDNNPINWVIGFAVLGTAINYLVGDLMVLPNLGNTVASIGDGAMAAITAYIIDLISPVFNTRFTTLVVLGILVALAEYFFHIYIKNSDKVAP